MRYWLLIVSILLIKLLSSSDSTAVNSFPINFDKNASYLIIVVDRLGLANRLRIMASAFSLSRKAVRKLVVLWAPSEECGAYFSDLFENDPDGTTVFNIEPASHSAIANAVQSLAEQQGFRVSSLYPKDFLVSVTELFAGADVPEVTMLWTRGVHVPSDYLCHQYLQVKSFFYQSLRPIQPIRDFVGAYTSAHFTSNLVIGVHIRAYDEQYDWAVVPPVNVESQQPIATAAVSALRFDEVGSVSTFINTISKIYEKHSEAIVFISSNSPQVIAEIKSTFKDKIILSSNTYQDSSTAYNILASDIPTLIANRDSSRNSVQSIQAALVDFILLSKTSFIIHTRSSSFAREAAFVNSIPILDILYENLIYSNDIDLSECGLDEYKRIKARYQVVCYDESYERQMCTRLIPLQLCIEKIIQWGLPSKTYCSTEKQIYYDSGDAAISILAETNGYSI